MKNAPDIDFGAIVPPAAEKEQAKPAAPAVGRTTRRQRLTAKAGDIMTMPVLGRDVTFILRKIPGSQVKSKTRVYANNERIQEHLNSHSLSDILPSIELDGIQVPAFGRRVENDITETADGSRRRMGAILTQKEYPVWEGDLTDEEMEHLTKVGNKYKETSAYERGKRYKRLLDTVYNGNQSELARAEGITRPTIKRCINTASLPDEIVKLFPTLNDITARMGDELNKNRNNLMLEYAESLKGNPGDPETLFNRLIASSSTIKAKPERNWDRDHWKIESKKGEGLIINVGEEVPEKTRLKIARMIEKELR